MSYIRRTKEEKERCASHYIFNWGRFKSHRWKKKRILRIEIQEVLSLGIFSKNELIEILDFLRQKGLGLPPLGVGKTKKQNFLTKEDMEI